LTVARFAFGLGVFVAAPIADACPRASRPWVRLETKDDSGASAQIARLLRAELTSRQIDLCDAADQTAPAPIAVVVTSIGETSASVRVGVRDSVTEKSLSRDLDLANVPSDTRALTVALAADELLRASWAELALASHAPPRPPPPEVLATIADGMRSKTARAPRVVLGAAAAVDAFGTGTVMLGADVVAAFWIVPRFRIEARFGVRSGLTTTSTDGDVAASALAGKLGALVTITPPARSLGVDVAARIGFIRASFVPTPFAGASGTSLTDVAVVGEATLDGWLRLSPTLRLFVDVGPAVAFRPVRITDGSRVVGGIDGAGVVSSLGIAGIF